MRTLLFGILALWISVLLIGCGSGKHRSTDVYLTVVSLHGSPTPPAGINHFNWGTQITAFAGLPVAAGPGVRYACEGWTGTGSAPPEGSTNSVTFVITQNSSITWLWKMQYELITSVSPFGTGIITCSPGGPWYDVDTSAQLTAFANEEYVFVNWTGDLSGDNNPSTLLMDTPKSVGANFSIMPVADFSAAPRSGNLPLTVDFTDLSTGEVNSWLWDFDNNGTVDSTLQNPTYTYDSNGTYTVNLTVRSAAGSDSKTKTHYITVGPPPPAYLWTHRIGSAGDDRAYAVCADQNSNIYIAGSFTSEVNFGADWGATDIKTSAGLADISVTKIRSDDSYAWTRRIGGISDDISYAVCSDASGNIYLAGTFKQTVNFAQDWGASDSKTSASSDTDIFVTKINSDDSYGWTRRIGGTGADTANAICTDSGGNIYLTGFFNGAVNFASDWGGTDTKTSAGSTDIFITRINADSSYAWTRRIGSTQQDRANAVCSNADNIYLAGSFSGTVNFAADWGATDTKTSAGTLDIFVCSVSTDGNYLWTHRIGGTDNDEASAICTDGVASIYVAGTFSSASVDFAEDWTETDSKKNAGSANAFVTKIAADGGYGWTRRIGDTLADAAYAVCSDSNRNIYIAGSFSSAVINFAADWNGNDEKRRVQNSDAFVTRINEDGTYGWTRALGGSGIDRANAICAAPTSAVYLGGIFEDVVNFARDWDATDIKSSEGVADMFVTKILP